MSVHETTAPACFGRGGGEPYDRALHTGGPLLLHEDATAGGEPGEARSVDVRRFLSRADRVERSLLASTQGSVLDVGCGPGRMVAEAHRRGRAALGVDVSPASVRVAEARGLSVHHGSVFGPVPSAGAWDVVLLLDGNVGIGGDPTQLLRRCRQIASPTGVLVVETSPQRHRYHRFTARVTSPSGHGSDAFPWAEVGADPLLEPAKDAGWSASREVRRRRRTFVVLAGRAP
ncbi:class I SAM-dependent methyltransferase [Oryzobacter telluris]|uniref:class I SAM-dependent methyltransferase n=1 Tax=Oryzobacter telluris TaxID=3149179 RepID=UPI00370D20DA